MTYDFGDSLKAGERGEGFLDKHFSKKFFIKKASRSGQRNGVDRHFIDKANGNTFSVEYKTDWTAGKTNNAFIETISVEKPGESKAGWLYTSEADFIVYFIPPLGLIYVLRRKSLKSKMNGWRSHCSEKSIPNNGYVTRGLCVPLAEIEKIAYKVINL